MKLKGVMNGRRWFTSHWFKPSVLTRSEASYNQIFQYGDKEKFSSRRYALKFFSGLHLFSVKRCGHDPGLTSMSFVSWKIRAFTDRTEWRTLAWRDDLSWICVWRVWFLAGMSRSTPLPARTTKCSSRCTVLIRHHRRWWTTRFWDDVANSCSLAKYWRCLPPQRITQCQWEPGPNRNIRSGSICRSKSRRRRRLKTITQTNDPLRKHSGRTRERKRIPPYFPLLVLLGPYVTPMRMAFTRTIYSCQVVFPPPHNRHLLH